MEILQQDCYSATVKLSAAELVALQGQGRSFAELLSAAESRSPEAEEALLRLPEDVRAVISDFDKDYAAAIRNFKEATVSMLSWAMQAHDQLIQLRSYLQAEQLADALGLRPHSISTQEVSG
jgi:hypothetical protein